VARGKSSPPTTQAPVAPVCAPIPAADPFPARHGDPRPVFAHAAAMDVPATVAEASHHRLLVSPFFFSVVNYPQEKRGTKG
jgi:hypothetical protein